MYEKYTYDVANTAQRVELIGQSSNTSVQRVSAGFMAPGQVAKQLAGNLVTTSNGATVTIDTVTTGKTFYITDVVVTSNVSTPLDFQIQSAGVVIFESHVSSTAPINAEGIETQPFATSGQLCRVFVSNSVAASSLNIDVYGFEQ